MKSLRLWGAIGLLLAFFGVADAQKPNRREGNLKEGGGAPDFTLQDPEGKKTVKLSQLKGKPVVLIFGSCT